MMIRIFLLLAVLPLLLGCLPEGNPIPKTKDDIKIISGFLGKEQFFIPEAYFKEGMADFNGGTISLQMIQPEFLPLIKSPQQMWKDGEQTKYILLLVQEKRLEGSFSNHIEERIKFFETFKKVGTEFDLEHLTQPTGYVQDQWDVWVERSKGKNISYITCGEKIIATDVPQCTQQIQTDNIYISINYDKRNLSDWKLIQKSIFEILESFKDSENAQNMLFKKYTAYKSEMTKGEK